MQTSRLFVALLVLSLACQTKPKQETATASEAAQPDSAAILASRPGPDAPRSAADRLVRALYFEHNKEDNPFREKDRALIEQYFAKPTADLIWNDTQQGGSKLKPTTTNPLFNAPDKAVQKTWVNPAAVAGTRAVVYVTFTNNAKPEEIKVDLQQFDGRWRITDMLYPNGKQLTEVLR
ncbi:hypothetical protein DYU11_12240 [Fibrisoma montanum]|uniref:DUF3828 domain-containing protein n=1 Tax=Fibrisoma montanum TaxID=2305895 RepID=A0A418MBJ5_9BACT|nr:hypothetical protein [Fibrisoma montanum]RIV23738.1 hypothetical protein DYU11_12240 [Fibrisoma montanum]